MVNKKIYLFRHGETSANVDGIISGIIDVPLNGTGEKQAELTGKMLVNRGICRLYSSYLNRAINTAKIVGREIGVDDIIVVDNLRETNFGDLEGKPRPTNVPDESYINDIQYPNGESRFQARKRFADTVLEICKKEDGDIIGIAAHGNVLRQFLINFGFENISAVRNCEIIEAEFDGENIKIINRLY